MTNSAFNFKTEKMCRLKWRDLRLIQTHMTQWYKAKHFTFDRGHAWTHSFFSTPNCHVQTQSTKAPRSTHCDCHTHTQSCCKTCPHVVGEKNYSIILLLLHRRCYMENQYAGHSERGRPHSVVGHFDSCKVDIIMCFHSSYTGFLWQMWFCCCCIFF